jgi:hypothetical protein
MKPPNRWDVAGFPVFALSWFGDPEDGTSIVACSGGGGSAKTGVKNYIAVTINADPEARQISTRTNVSEEKLVFSGRGSEILTLSSSSARNCTFTKVNRHKSYGFLRQ